VLPDELGPGIERLVTESPLKLKMISNRGTKVYPPSGAITDCVDQFRCRFTLQDGTSEVTDDHIFELVQRIGSRYRWAHIEKLQEFDGEAGYTKAQGED
jgi:isocitrate dehydrogenase